MSTGNKTGGGAADDRITAAGHARGATASRTARAVVAQSRNAGGLVRNKAGRTRSRTRRTQAALLSTLLQPQSRSSHGGRLPRIRRRSAFDGFPGPAPVEAEGTSMRGRTLRKYLEQYVQAPTKGPRPEAGKGRRPVGLYEHFPPVWEELTHGVLGVVGTKRPDGRVADLQAATFSKAAAVRDFLG